jgi:hypothetical protein
LIERVGCDGQLVGGSVVGHVVDEWSSPKSEHRKRQRYSRDINPLLTDM